MPTCKTCNVDKPQDDFYKIRQKAGNYTYRKECRECFSNKESSRYHIKVGRKGRYRLAYCLGCSSWKIKSINFELDSNKCYECVKNELETKLEDEQPVEVESIIEELSPEITPLELEPDPLYKTCRVCNETKSVDTGYYRSGGLVCKDCKKLKENDNRKDTRQKKLEEYGGSEYVRVKPNDYSDEYQRKHTFDVLEAIGWKFNTENNIWYKDGIKTKDGVFINVIPKPVPQRKPRIRIRKKLGPTFKDKMEELKRNNIKTIIELYGDGYSQSVIAELYNVSRPTITKWIKEDKQK